MRRETTPSDRRHPVKGLRLRDIVRLRGVPLIARVGHRLGFKWQDLGARLGREVLIAQGPSLRDGAAPAHEAALDIVFATFQGLNQHVVSVDVVLARALSARGHRVRFVLCDQVLPLCQSKHAGFEKRWPIYCAHCYGFADRFIRSAGFEVIRFTDLVDPDECPEDDRWKVYVESALLKHYRVGTLSETPDVRERRQKFRRTAAISAGVGRAIASLGPDRVIMSHGLYCTWGPAREVLIDAGIPVVTTGPGKKKQTITFNWTLSNDTWDVSTEWERVKDDPLTPAQESRLDEYLSSRRAHNRDARVYNFGEEESVEETKRRLNLDDSKRTYCLFTNVLWDAASAQREIAFSDPVEWVMETIRWFGQQPEKQLIVKIHPAEVVIGTKQPFISEIRKHFPEIPDNVRVIEPDEKVNSWSIIRITDVGLVHTSTVGLEMPLEGVPCVVVSRTHYRGKGFTLDVENRDDYFKLLSEFDPKSVDTASMVGLARRYAYLLFERYQIPFPFTHERQTYDVRALKEVSSADLLKDESIQAIIDGLENHSELLLPE